MDKPNLRVIDVALGGYRLVVTASSVPMRPLFSVALWRCPPGRHLFWWAWEGESGH